MMMLRQCNRTRRSLQFRLSRSFSSSSPSSSSSSSSSSSTSPTSQNSVQHTKDLKNGQKLGSPPPPMLHHPSSLSPLTFSLSKGSLLLSAALISAVIASFALISTGQSDKLSKHKPLYTYADLEHVLEKSNDSMKKIINRMKQTGTAASVLWQSLRSVLSSANHEVRSGFELRVAALLADIAAANAGRRSAIVGAGGGRVLDWLLETVCLGDNVGTQAESARALAYLIADPNVCEEVLGRPHAVPSLLRFIFSFQPQKSKKQPRRSSFDMSDSLKGRSMLVAALMDIVTSNSDDLNGKSFQPSLPGNAEMRDIAAAIEVIEEGGMHLDESNESEDDEDGGKGLKGIGIKILGGTTTVLGLSRTGLMTLEDLNTIHVDTRKSTPKPLVFQKNHHDSLSQVSISSVVPGLWDDLHCQHVAVPFAAWALANWAKASEVNRAHIQELDQDGHAVMTALMAPERSVKLHGSLVARLLLDDHNLPLNDSVAEWASSLLSTVSQASKSEDIPLAEVALSAFLVSIERSSKAKKVVMEKGLQLMRECAKHTVKHKNLQEALAKVLQLLCTGDMHLSLEESQKWSGILLLWVCGKLSTEAIRSSATKILACILEDYGPFAVPISQGWLAIILAEVLGSLKTTSFKGSTQPRNDKVKTQIDQANILSATQALNQLAGTVVNLAGSQLGKATDSVDTLPLSDLLSLEPFAGPLKSLNKSNFPKVDAADSAVSTLKGVKSLTELSAEDSQSQNKLADFGILCLLRRFLLKDDYEKLAANEAYNDASRAIEAQDRASNAPNDLDNSNNPSSIRVPPTAHIRRHAARLLTIMSLLPKIQRLITEDETLCKWLEDCANGNIPGCDDLKIQSYARATLLNVFCSEQNDDKQPDVVAPNERNNICPRYNDMIFLINPELPHWKCPETVNSDKSGRNPRSTSKSDGYTKPEVVPPLDVVFIHGLRGGPFKTWRITEDKVSTKSGLVEKIDEEAGKQGTFWPREWLSYDFPHARLFTLKYKTNLTQWSGASLPLQEVSSMLLEKLVAAGIGNRPVVFVTHSMGGLVVKQMLYQAKAESNDDLVNNTVGVIFYSCPHFGSKLADMPWRMGLVFRPAPSIGELRSGSPRLVELNDYIHHLHKKGNLEVLSFCETKVTPIVEGYGGWAFRMEIVPIESAYPGFGELVVLESTDHINSCKPINRTDPSYTETLQFLQKLKSRRT